MKLAITIIICFIKKNSVFPFFTLKAILPVELYTANIETNANTMVINQMAVSPLNSERIDFPNVDILFLFFYLILSVMMVKAANIKPKIQNLVTIFGSGIPTF